VRFKIKLVVTDPATGKYPDLEALCGEPWAASLMSIDMEGFALDEEGNLFLIDECGTYAYPPNEDRFNWHIEIDPKVN